MKLTEKQIDCIKIPDYRNSNRKEIFKIAVFTFNYQEDKSIIDKFISKGEELANKVNPAAANISAYSRGKTRLINNTTAGVLAEYCWKEYINYKAGKDIVDYTEFKEAATQIDLITVNSGKLIEVRSSFPRNGIEFAICHNKYEFDILGPYSNLVKPGEIQKDYYTRTLFHVPSRNTFLELIKSSKLEVFLTGGATWEMMTDNNYSKNKNLLPEDAFAVHESETSTYRVVPFSKALDTEQICNLIIESEE